jgi:hypothetical protein
VPSYLFKRYKNNSLWRFLVARTSGNLLGRFFAVLNNDCSAQDRDRESKPVLLVEPFGHEDPEYVFNIFLPCL